MADTEKKSSTKGPDFRPETQQERWVKYGANVALSVVVVLLLAGLVVYIAGRIGWRKDTTAAGAYSLKPQTVNLIGNLPQKVHIVGLFTKAKQEQETRIKEDDPSVRYQEVADLLQEYQTKSNGKISVEMIDPITEPSKVDKLFNDVARKYGNDYKKYEEVMSAYPGTLDQINKLSKEEIDALKKASPKIADQKMARMMGEVVVTVEIFPALLDEIQRNVKKQLELKVPDYKGAADQIRSGLEGLNDRVDSVLKAFKTAKDDAKTPKEFKDYIVSAEPRYEAMKKASDDLLKKISGLGELKQLDELRQNKTNSIAVLAENDMKVLPSTAIFKSDAANRMIGTADGKLKPRFAGEQQISTAVYTLTAKEKRKVAFIRSGGPPSATSIPMAGYSAPFTEVADRLRDYGIEVLDKDVSGQWQMQAMQMQMQGMPLPPEPTDEQLKDAVWIVLITPQDPRQLMQNPSAGMLGPKVNEHLKAGGTAMLLVDPQTEKMDFLKEWGIETQPEYLVVHDQVAGEGHRSEDITMEWQRQQPVFIVNDYGDHPVTKPLRSLDGLMVPVIPVKTVDAKGVKTTRILPIPNDPRTWGDTDFDSLRQGKAVTFNPKDERSPDIAGPFWGGAIAEKDNGKGRLIVIGCSVFARDDYLRIPNIPASRQQERFVARFPGNAELFVNGVFWLANMDTMIAISPMALEVPRVEAIPDARLGMLRVGLLIVALPLMVLAAGTFVYLKRRD
ncbi:MAG TPA: Gldg family protein [Tepidisphaeraceae bacterium]|jgi:hypothetical protein